MGPPTVSKLGEAAWTTALPVAKLTPTVPTESVGLTALSPRRWSILSLRVGVVWELSCRPSEA